MTKRLFPILLIVFTNILGAGVIIPILPLYAEGVFGGTILQITLLSTAFFGAQFFAAPFLGRLSDRYGRRPILMFSQMGTVAAFVLFIFAETIGVAIDRLELTLPLTGGMLMLYVARTLDGITGGNLTTAQAYISDITSERDRAQGLGLLQAAFGLGFIFGPAFGGVLSSYGSVVPFIGAAIITTITLLLTTFTLEESLRPDERRRQASEPRIASFRLVRGQRALANVLIIGFLAASAFAALPATFALFADHVLFADVEPGSPKQLYIGLLLTWNGFARVITQVALLRPLVKRLGERRLLLLGEISWMAAFLSIALARNPIMAGFALAVYAFGLGVSEPNLQSLTTRFGREGLRGQLLGLYQSARSLALIFGPIWAGIVFDRISPRAVYFAGAGIMAIAVLFAVLLITQEIPGGESRRDPTSLPAQASSPRS